MSLSLFFVDVEANGPCPGLGVMTEFGCVHYPSKKTFHGVIYEAIPDPAKPVMSKITGDAVTPLNSLHSVMSEFDLWIAGLATDRTPKMISDNPAYDFQWINHAFWTTLGRTPFGHSARRIGDFYAGLVGNFGASSRWKSLRVTPHDHNPVNDAMGNVEAFIKMLHGERV